MSAGGGGARYRGGGREGPTDKGRVEFEISVWKGVLLEGIGQYMYK